MNGTTLQVSQQVPRGPTPRVRSVDWRGVVVAPAVIFAILLSISIGVAAHRHTHQRERLQGEVETAASQTAGVMESMWTARIAALRAFRDQLHAAPERLGTAFDASGRAMISRNSSIKMIEWVNRLGIVEHALPLRPNTVNTPGHDVAREALWKGGWDAAWGSGGDAVAGYRMTPQDCQIRCIFPVLGTDPQAGPTGMLLARVNMDDIARAASNPLRNDFQLLLRSEDIVLFATSPRPVAAATTRETGFSAAQEAYQLSGGNDGRMLNWTAEGLPADAVTHVPPELSRRRPPYLTVRRINVLDRTWNLEVCPTDAMVAANLDRSPWVIGIGGSTASLLLAGLFSQFMYSRATHERRRQEYLVALERLNRIATAISGRLGAPRDMLDQLAEAARELLQVDRSGICLLASNGDELRVVAVAGDVPEAASSEFTIADLPMCREVLRSRRPLFVGDVGRVTLEMNSDVAALFNARSLMLLPLMTSEQQLGIMALSSSKPRDFTDEHKRLAELLASKAAVILSNSELYSRMAEALRSQQTLFEQREAIFAVNAAVYQAATLNESLQMIAELAPGVLGVDLCIVTLNAEGDDCMRIAAITKPNGAHLVGTTFNRRGTNGEVVRLTRRTLVIEEAHGHPGVQPVFQRQLNIGSVAYLPLLRTGGAFMGTLVLVRHRAGPFAPEQLNLAELFTVRAAAAVENAELLEQTRRDTQAKTMLLRELNHRVKNNLASIITLLSLDEPEMSAKARKWLRRAIDRIRTMARTHDLFSGGIERVPLVDLVQQTIPSLSVVRPPTVVIESDVQANVTLRTDRAVSLAMVLHELCYNAIIHGLAGGAGTVLIRARMEDGRDLVDLRTPPVKGVLLEVIDSAGAARRALGSGEDSLASKGMRDAGLGMAAVAVVASVLEPETRGDRVGSGGLGLLLVDGLVTRELSGEFSLNRGERETVARVWFPVAAEDRIA